MSGPTRTCPRRLPETRLACSVVDGEPCQIELEYSPFTLARHIDGITVYVSTDYEYHYLLAWEVSVDLKKLVSGVLLGLVVLWIIGKASSRSHKPDAPQVVQASPGDKWRVTEKQSSMDDSKTVVVTLDSEDQIQGPLGTVRPSLIVRCQEKKVDVYVVTHMAANVEADDEHVVGIRLDDGSPRHENWSESTDHQALFASDIIWNGDEPTFSGGRIEFAKRLAGANQLTFQFTPFDGSPQVARFDIRGLDPHLHKVAEACGWSYE